jgi:hypothetical protein
MKRRNFIAISATALVGISIPFACSSEDYKSIVSVMPKPLPLGKFCTEKELKGIGTNYIQLIPEENQLSTIGKHIFKNETGQLVDPNPAAIEKLINEKMQKDFQAGNTTIVDGWIISITEARVCGILSLV